VKAHAAEYRVDLSRIAIIGESAGPGRSPTRLNLAGLGEYSFRGMGDM
jgi:hypothetical protein